MHLDNTDIYIILHGLYVCIQVNKMSYTVLGQESLTSSRLDLMIFTVSFSIQRQKKWRALDMNVV